MWCVGVESIKAPPILPSIVPSYQLNREGIRSNQHLSLARDPLSQVQILKSPVLLHKRMMSSGISPSQQGKPLRCILKPRVPEIFVWRPSFLCLIFTVQMFALRKKVDYDINVSSFYMCLRDYEPCCNTFQVYILQSVIFNWLCNCRNWL